MARPLLRAACMYAGGKGGLGAHPRRPACFPRLLEQLLVALNNGVKDVEFFHEIPSGVALPGASPEREGK